MSIEEDITQLSDYLLKSQGLVEVILRKLGAVSFKPASELPVAHQSTPLMPERLDPFPSFIPGKFIESLTGQIADDIVYKDVNQQDGPKPIAEVPFTDGTKTIKVALWGDFAKAIEIYSKGQVVTITNLKIRPPYQDMEQLNSTKNTQIS